MVKQNTANVPIESSILSRPFRFTYSNYLPGSYFTALTGDKKTNKQ
jgi:hypothetical protein